MRSNELYELGVDLNATDRVRDKVTELTFKDRQIISPLFNRII
jgi:hypothetical protein